MNPHQEQQAALLNRIAHNVDKLNESLEQVNAKLESVNEKNQPTVVLSQVWHTFTKNVQFNLEGLGGLQPPE
ncbi:hypothetical protein BGZ73_003785 [Actinomortierella ambigua]|nr:hypothetical protein BGZ73_003785 [Actinomortierella ambigua]